MYIYIYINYLHGSRLVSPPRCQTFCVCVCARARVCVCVYVCVYLAYPYSSVYMRCFSSSRKHLHPTELPKRATSLRSLRRVCVCVCACVWSKQDTLPIGIES